MNNLHPIFKGILARQFGSQSFNSSAYEQERLRRESLDGIKAGARQDTITVDRWNGEKWIQVTMYWDGKRYTERRIR